MKKYGLLIIMFMMTLCLTGCNNAIFDTNYTFDYAECYLNGNYEKIEIKKWTDYDGEQIQIIAKDGNTYLVSMNYCRLVRED